jgi:hypothetical protein
MANFLQWGDKAEGSRGLSLRSRRHTRKIYNFGSSQPAGWALGRCEGAQRHGETLEGWGVYTLVREDGVHSAEKLRKSCQNR